MFQLLKRVLTVRETHDSFDPPLDRVGREKMKCEQCGKFVGGLNQHRKAVHGSPKRAKAISWKEADAIEDSRDDMDLGDK